MANQSKNNSDRVTRALNVREPWAWAVVSGFKTIENRTFRPTSILGQRIAVLASDNRAELGKEEIREFLMEVDEKVADALCDDRVTEDAPLFVCGAIVGTVRVLGSIDMGALGDDEEAIIDECHKFPESPTGIPHEEWAFGPILWVLGDAERFAEPIPAKGKLGVWNLTADQIEKVRVARGNLIDDPGQPVEWGLRSVASGR